MSHTMPEVSQAAKENLRPISLNLFPKPWSYEFKPLGKLGKSFI